MPGLTRSRSRFTRHLGLELVDEAEALGAGAHHAHLSAQDVPELWHLIEAALAQETSDARHTGIVAGRPPGTVALGIDGHGAQFPDLERAAGGDGQPAVRSAQLPAAAAVMTHPVLAIEHRARRVELDDQSEQRQQQGERGQPDDRH